MNARAVSVFVVLVAFVLLAVFAFGVGGGELAAPEDDAGTVAGAPGPETAGSPAAGTAETAELTTGRTQVPVGQQPAIDLEAGPSVANAARATVRGIVRDEDGVAVAGARVRAFANGELRGARTFTNEQGRFVLVDIPPGAITVRADHDRRGKGSQSVTALLGAAADVAITLSRGFVLHGRVVTDADEPAKGVRVTCSWPGTNKLAATDDHGRFEIANCVEQLVSFRVEGPGIVRLHQPGVDPRAGDVVLRVQALAEPSGTITGVVHDPLGQVIAQLPVLAGRAGQSVLERLEVATGPDGRFTFSPLIPGDWYLTVAKNGHPELELGPVVLAANATANVGVMRFQVGGTVRATIRGSNPSGVRFRVRRHDGGASGGSVSREDGVLQSSLLTAGAYNLTVTGDGTAAQTIAFAVRDGEVTRFDVTLQQGVSQRFEVAVPAHAPKGEAVRLQVARGADPVIAKLVTRASGVAGPPRSTRIHLAPGNYTATVVCGTLQATVPFTVGADEGPAVRLTLR